jgi:aryl sulfotransferase
MVRSMTKPSSRPGSSTEVTSAEDRNAQLQSFPFRAGDIVISTPAKCGTTWMQMICALLVFQTPELPRPLYELSPPLAHSFEELEAQQHRRFIKTHVPLDALPLRSDVYYIVVGRHPLDQTVSLFYQDLNFENDGPAPALEDWLHARCHGDGPLKDMDNLDGVLWHLYYAWTLRARSNVLLTHYDDLSADLDAEMRRIAAWLGITVAEEIWPDLVRAATFENMKGRADDLAPSHGILKDPSAFFRRGRSGSGREQLDEQDLAAYRARTKALAPADFLAWLHRDTPAA